MLSAQHWNRLAQVPPPPLQLSSRSFSPTFLFLLLLLPVPSLVGVGLGHRLDRVGGERPHVTDGV